MEKEKVLKGKTTKEKIQEEALKLFARYGYVGTSMSDIAGQLNLTKQALYKHYTNKQEILDSLVDKMNKEDVERVRKFEMPEGSMNEVIEGYKKIDLDKIKKYTVAQFLHWTEEEFAASFRKMITIEQYRDEKMSRLYQYYLADGPVSNMQEIFKGLTQNEADARQIALDFYGPIFLLYSIYDKTKDKQSVLNELANHVDRFASLLKNYNS